MDTNTMVVPARVSSMLGAIGGCCVLLVMAGCARQPAPAVPPASATDASAYKPVATYQEIMDSIVDPAGDYIWKSVATSVDSKGFHETQPHTAIEWHEFRRRAVILVEAANLIAVPGRRVANGTKTVEDGGLLEVEKIQRRLDAQHDELVDFAGALRDIGVKLVAAADQQDATAVTEHGGTLDEVCEACHKVFWYPDEPKTGTVGK
jgi:hypothetical protein